MCSDLVTSSNAFFRRHRWEHNPSDTQWIKPLARIRSPRLLTGVLYAYAVELTWLERGEGVEDRRHERLEVHDTIGWRADKKHAERQRCEVLLELDAPVHRDQRVVFAMHTPQKLTVRDARPAAADHGVDTVALERCGKV